MLPIEFKKVEKGDAKALQAISIHTFMDTYASRNTAENMKLYVSREFAVEKLENEIVDKNIQYYFAVCNEEVIGYMKLNKGIAQTDLKTENGLEIERIYVEQKYQGKAVGKRLLEKAMECALEEHIDFLWLGVWEENNPAIQFYLKHNFKEFGKHTFILGNEEQMDIMMKRILK